MLKMQLLTIYLSCWLLMDLEHEKWLGIQNFNGATDLKRFPGSSREKHTMHNFFAGIITFPSPMRIAREDGLPKQRVCKHTKNTTANAT